MQKPPKDFKSFGGFMLLWMISGSERTYNPQPEFGQAAHSLPQLSSHAESQQ